MARLHPIERSTRFLYKMFEPVTAYIYIFSICLLTAADYVAKLTG